MTRMFSRHGAKKFPQLATLADRRPRGLNEFAAQSWISAVRRDSVQIPAPQANRQGGLNELARV